jgi:hypothetical protein
MIEWLDILHSDKYGNEWIVLYRDPFFPDKYPEWFLLSRHGNILSIGDRLPIRYAAAMQRTGKKMDRDRLNMSTITEPPCPTYQF